jgi:hypothetical protein
MDTTSSAEKHFSEITVDPQEAQDIVDRYFTEAAKLTARLWSKHPRSRHTGAPPEIQFSTNLTWKDVGRAIRAWVLDRALERCNCYSCRTQGGKRGRRENYWISLVCLARMGDPSALVKHLNSRRALTQFDRRCLADLLDANFKGEFNAPRIGRPKKIAARSCASIAVKQYKDWKAINRQYRIRDWGHSDEMKEEACRIAIDYHVARNGGGLMSNHPMNEVPTFEQVRELMERPTARRR